MIKLLGGCILFHGFYVEWMRGTYFKSRMEIIVHESTSRPNQQIIKKIEINATFISPWPIHLISNE